MFRRRRENRAQTYLAKVAAMREAERRSRRTPLDDLPPLLRELVEIGMGGGFLVEDGRYERTREIGRLLYVSQGLDAMVTAYQEVADWVPFQRRHLEHAWDGIGDWQS